jgi:hypothetical protein
MNTFALASILLLGQYLYFARPCGYCPSPSEKYEVAHSPQFRRNTLQESLKTTVEQPIIKRGDIAAQDGKQ